MKNQLILGVITALIAGGLLFNYDTKELTKLQQFEQFKSSFSRNYDLQENIYRFSIFASNVEKYERHNADKTQTYTMGINQFSDMTTQEFIQKILMKNLETPNNVERIQAKGISAPDELDWRTKNVVNPVKNQGGCGSCWAFSTTGSLQSTVAIAKKILHNFSEQQLVDCCGPKGFQCQGCNGAWPEWAFNYINSAGIVLQNQYAYTGRQGACQNTPTAQKFLNSARPSSMIANDPNAIKQSLATSGPLSVCLDASNWGAYKSGVFSNCGTTTLNHAVTLIGYSADGTWIVRNSWGTAWGQQGHIRIKAGNTCGIQSHVVIPNLA